MGREGIRWGEYGTANRFTYHNPPIESPRKEKNGRPQPTILQEERGWPGAFTAEESDAGAGAAADADAEAGADLAELIGRDLRQLPEKPLLAPSAAVVPAVPFAPAASPRPLLGLSGQIEPGPGYSSPEADDSAPPGSSRPPLFRGPTHDAGRDPGSRRPCNASAPAGGLQHAPPIQLQVAVQASSL